MYSLHKTNVKLRGREMHLSLIARAVRNDSDKARDEAKVKAVAAAARVLRGGAQQQQMKQQKQQTQHGGESQGSMARDFLETLLHGRKIDESVPVDRLLNALSVGANLKQRGIKASSVIGRGGFGVALSGRVIVTGRQVVIKMVFLPKSTDIAAFERETTAHKKMRTVLGARAVRPIDVYIAESGTLRLGVQIMERARGPLADIISEPAFLKDDAAMQGIAAQIRDIVATLEQNSMVHGDMHVWNLVYTLGKKGEIGVMLIDFGRTVWDVKDPLVQDADRFMVWTAAMLQANRPFCGCLANALRAVQFPMSMRLSSQLRGKLFTTCALAVEKDIERHYDAFLMYMDPLWTGWGGRDAAAVKVETVGAMLPLLEV
jgi:hypothetical protein